MADAKAVFGTSTDADASGPEQTPPVGGGCKGPAPGGRRGRRAFGLPGGSLTAGLLAQLHVCQTANLLLLLVTPARPLVEPGRVQFTYARHRRPTAEVVADPDQPRLCAGRRTSPAARVRDPPPCPSTCSVWEGLGWRNSRASTVAGAGQPGGQLLQLASVKPPRVCRAGSRTGGRVVKLPDSPGKGEPVLSSASAAGSRDIRSPDPLAHWPPTMPAPPPATQGGA